MELTAEITKVFGQEMAKLFAGQISEEELNKTAQEAWRELNEHEYRYGDRQKSKLEKMISELITNKVMEKVEELLKVPQNAELINKEATRIVLEARSKASELIISKMAEGIAAAPFIDWNMQEMASQISYAIVNRG